MGKRTSLQTHFTHYIRIREKKMSQSYNAYDKYLEWVWSVNGTHDSFDGVLFEAMHRANDEQLEKLKAGFPEQVKAFKLFTDAGIEAIAAKCTKTHPVLILKGSL